MLERLGEDLAYGPLLEALHQRRQEPLDHEPLGDLLAEHLSEQTRFGFAQRALLNFGDATEPYNVGSQGAAAPAGTLGGPEFFHNQNYGAAVDKKGNADCETGQRGYPKKLNYFDPQGRNFATDQHTPGDQGPTFHGRTRVPKDETFTHNPSTGPQTPYNPSNP